MVSQALLEQLGNEIDDRRHGKLVLDFESASEARRTSFREGLERGGAASEMCESTSAELYASPEAVSSFSFRLLAPDAKPVPITLADSLVVLAATTLKQHQSEPADNK
jgi:hypothetical protein